ncbi:MAG TPA: penicillin acylase family protein, partial [Candidatus Kapabacteria bacterium]|nr:penicillin acylase family protein [Candidatus Kapabacteria bacterium]
MSLRKILIGGGVSVLLILIGFGLFCYHVVTKSFPQTEGTISGLGVSSPVKIYRDPYGIPHIIATNEDDAYFAIGYLHAQERLFQMDMQRRAGEGRLSEVFGTRTIPYDAMFRTIGIKRIAERIEASLHPEVRRALEDYSRGVNAYIAQNIHRLPVEFDMLNYKPYEWTPLHSIILSRMMAWELNMGWWGDITLQDIINKVGMKDALELFPQYPADAPVIMQEEHGETPAPLPNGHTASVSPLHFQSMTALHDLAATDKAFHEFIGYPHYQTGSNAWAVSPQKSTTGKPILCNDPHLIITTPSPWYQVHISAGTLNVAGYTVPGDPFVVIGRNNAVAWGETNAMLDDCDFIVEQLDSTNSSRYLLHGAYRDMSVRNDTIHVKDTENVVIKIYRTEHGPIISAVHPFNYPSQLFKQDGLRSDSASMLHRSAVAMHWTGSEATDENYALWKIDHAQNVREFVDGVQYFGCPAQNFVYADTAGNIGYALGGKIPLRATPIPGQSVPVPGAQESEIWNSFVPFALQPKFQNPKSGFIATANNKISDRMDYYFTNIWEPPSRISRITTLLQSQQKLSPDDMKRIQYDYISPYAFDLTHYIIAAFPDSATQQPLVKQALTYFSNWDGSMSKEVIAASVFNVWMEKMIEEMFKERLGEPVYEEYLFLQSLP